MSIKELRAKAREVGSDKKMAIALPLFLWLVLLYFLGRIFQWVSGPEINPIVGIIYGILALLLTLSGGYALITRCLQVARGEETSSFFKEAFGSGITNSLKVACGLFLKLLPLFILLAVAVFLYFYGVASSLGGIDKISQIADGSLKIDDITFDPSGVVWLILGLVLAFIVEIVLTVKSFKYLLVTFLKHDYPDEKVKELINKSGEMMYGNKAKAFVIPYTFIGWILLAVVISVIVGALVGAILSMLDSIILSAIATVITYFIMSFVYAYMLLTMTEFYLERNPLEINNPDYVKPETNSPLYTKIAALIICLPIILSIILVGVGTSLYNKAVESIQSSSMQMDGMTEYLQSIEDK